jgi:hypothetical protein
MRRGFLKYKKRFLFIFILFLVSWLIISPLSITYSTQSPNVNNNINNLELSVNAAHSNIKQKHSLNSFSQAYPHLIKCITSYAQPWSPHASNQKSQPVLVNIGEYARPASNLTHSLRITRALLVYYPIESSAHFEPELKWLYRSWIEMQKYEPIMWRTDLVIFLERDRKLFDNENYFFNKLNCKFENLRKGDMDAPMCTLIEFVPLQKRTIKEMTDKSKV